MELGWQQITAQFGAPVCGDGAERRPVRICAVGYGKLGGMELGYSSDLDLVFLHDSRGERQETAGARPIDNQLFFVRLAQRIVHLLTMHSAAGRLYEVDVRLRPSGKGGMLVTNIEAFAEYQQTGGLDLGAPGAAACARSGRRAGELRARVRSRTPGRAVPARAARHAAGRGAQHARAHAQGAVESRARPVRHQAGCRRRRRYRVPGAVLGARVGAGRIRRWRCSRTPSGSSSPSLQPISSPRRRWTSSPAPIAPTAPALTTCRSPVRHLSCRRRSLPPSAPR